MQRRDFLKIFPCFWGGIILYGCGSQSEEGVTILVEEKEIFVPQILPAFVSEILQISEIDVGIDLRSQNGNPDEPYIYRLLGKEEGEGFWRYWVGDSPTSLSFPQIGIGYQKIFPDQVIAFRYS